MGWINNPKKAAYNNIYKKTTAGVDELLSNTNYNGNIIKSPKDIVNQVVSVLNENSNIILDEKELKRYIQTNDYVGLSICYENAFKQFYNQREYLKALEIKISSIYLKHYDELKESDIWNEESCYIEDISTYSNKLKELLKKVNIHIDDFEERYEFMINQLPTIIEKYVFFLSDFDIINSYRANLNKYL